MVGAGLSSKEAAYAQLKRAILTAAVRPGQPFSERVLAARFHLSRTPVREILRRLEREHLVELVPRRGAFVRRLDPWEVLEIFQARETVEPAAARLAAARAEPAVLRRLVALEPHDGEVRSVPTRVRLTRRGEACARMTARSTV